MAADRSEQAYMDQIAGGDQEAFTALYKQYSGCAFNLAYRTTQSSQAAEEAVQEAFLQVWGGASQFDSSRGSVRNWLLRIVVIESLKVMNRSSRERRRIEKRKASLPIENPVREPVELLENKEQVSAIRKALNKLSLSDQQLLSMYYVAGMRQGEIGDLLSIPQRTVSRRMEQALGNLKKSVRRTGVTALSSGSLTGLLEVALDGTLEPPQNLLGRLLERLGDVPQNATPHTGPAVPASTSSKIFPALLAGTGLLLAAGFFWWHSWGGNAATSSTLKSSSTDASSVQFVPDPPLSESASSRRFHWDFNDPEALKAWTLVLGKWRHRSNGGWEDSGCIEILGTQIVVFRPKVDLGPPPYRITFRYKLAEKPEPQVERNLSQRAFLMIPPPPQAIDTTVITMAPALRVDPRVPLKWIEESYRVDRGFNFSWRDGNLESIWLTSIEGECFIMTIGGHILIDELSIEPAVRPVPPNVKAILKIAKQLREKLPPYKETEVPELRMPGSRFTPTIRIIPAVSFPYHPEH